MSEDLNGNGLFFSQPATVMSAHDVEEIHQLTLDILSGKGILIHLPEAREILSRQGARLDGEVVFLDEPVVDKLMGTAPDSFEMKGRDSSLPPLVFGKGQTRPVVCPGNGTLSVIESDGRKRPGTIEDFDNITRLCQTSHLVDMVGAIPIEPSGMPDKSKHLHLLRHLMRYSHKPLIGVATDPEETRQSFTLLEMVYGNGFLKENHVIAYSVNPTSPLGFDPLACQTLITYAEHRQVLFILPGPMAGLTAPLDMYGMLAVINAENLAGICLTQAVSPGTPVVYSSGAMTSDMRWANTITAAPEGTLIGMACMQMARYYNLPSRAMAGLSEAKQADFQAGMETMQNYLSHVMAGVGVVNECLGVLDSIMSTSFEKWILDEELINRVELLNRGMGRFDRQSVFNMIQNVDHMGTYLMERAVFENCHKVWRPNVSFWQPYDMWAKKRETLLQRAKDIFNERIESVKTPLLEPGLDNELNAYIQSL